MQEDSTSAERRTVLLEVIGDTVEDAIAAAQYGADRIELIAAIREGGLTPSCGMIEEVVRSVAIPVHVMVRPHSRSFRYDRGDLAAMARDIRFIRSSGAAGIVVGALTSGGEVDAEALRLLLDEAGELAVTFHRAFDEAADQFQALEALQAFPQVNRILTSGGKPNVMEAQERIRALVERSRRSGIAVMAGSGLKLEGLSEFVAQTGVREVHFGSWVRCGGDAAAPIDPVRLAAVKRLLGAVIQ